MLKQITILFILSLCTVSVSNAQGGNNKVNEDSLKWANTINQKKADIAEDEEEKKHYLGMTKQQIVRGFGSLEEYERGYNMFSKSPTHRVIFTGHPTGWASMLLTYLHSNCSCTITDDKGNYFVSGDVMWLNFQAHCSTQTLNVKVSRVGNWEDAKTTELTITGGDGPMMAKIFLEYWENTTIDKNKLKKGAVVTQDFLSDRITFNWKGTTPFITVDTNPDYHK